MAMLMPSDLAVKCRWCSEMVTLASDHERREHFWRYLAWFLSVFPADFKLRYRQGGLIFALACVVETARRWFEVEER